MGEGGQRGHLRSKKRPNPHNLHPFGSRGSLYSLVPETFVILGSLLSNPRRGVLRHGSFAQVLRVVVRMNLPGLGRKLVKKLRENETVKSAGPREGIVTRVRARDANPKSQPVPLKRQQSA
jgi:hypothetical protein